MTQTITIPIYPIVDQINAKVHYTAKSKSASAEGEAIIAELSEGENEDMIANSIDKALARVSGIIGIYAPNTISRTPEFGSLEATTLEEGEDNQEITISLTLPSNYDTKALASLKDAVARYCEGVAMQDWTSVAVPSDVEHYTQSQIAAIADIRRAMLQRTRPQYEDDSVRIEDSIEVIYPNE